MPAELIGDRPVLEAVYEDKGSEWCAVITHPHSLMGGNMHNNVVMASWDACLGRDLSAVRFNFRGVGRSGGSFDEGRGEMDDLAQVITYVQKPVIIIGYSFGAWVAARYVKRINASNPCIFISPPNAMFEFPSIMSENVWAIVGESDQFSSIPGLEGLVKEGHLTVARHVDHFWFGDEDQLIRFIKDKLDLML
jgi:uncharacterized protein